MVIQDSKFFMGAVVRVAKSTHMSDMAGAIGKIHRIHGYITIEYHETRVRYTYDLVIVSVHVAQGLPMYGKVSGEYQPEELELV